MEEPDGASVRFFHIGRSHSMNIRIAGDECTPVEIDDPFHGLMKVSSAPVRYAVAHLGQ